MMQAWLSLPEKWGDKQTASQGSFWRCSHADHPLAFGRDNDGRKVQITAEFEAGPKLWQVCVLLLVARQDKPSGALISF